MIRFILRSLLFWLKIFARNQRFRYRVYKAGGWAGKPLNLLNDRNVQIGNNVRIKDGYRLECYETFYSQNLSPKCVIEQGVIIGPSFTAFVACDLIIHKDTIFAGNVTLITENHGMNPELDTPYHAQPLTLGPIEIGENCWLGQNVSILPNVTIGKGCVIASNSVVKSDVPDFSIAAGSPARVVKRFNFETHKWERV